jgi:D-alanyl-D-alanine carboxypeptidase
VSILHTVLSVTVAAASLLTSGVNAVMPQLDTASTVFIINRDYMITSGYIPDLRDAKVPGQVRRMRPDAADALEEMIAAAKKEAKISLAAVSGYRSYNTQQNIYNRRLASGTSIQQVNAYVAVPGASEHQLGLAMDIGTASSGTRLSPGFGDTKAGKWVADNCWRFGFAIRYQAGWESITGYNAEPWHIRYVGRDAAKAVYEQNIPLEIYINNLQVSLLIGIIDR